VYKQARVMPAGVLPCSISKLGKGEVALLAPWVGGAKRFRRSSSEYPHVFLDMPLFQVRLSNCW
jgi:hypothetical protein